MAPPSPRRRVHDLERRLAGRSSALMRDTILLRERGAALPDGGTALGAKVGRMQVGYTN